MVHREAKSVIKRGLVLTFGLAVCLLLFLSGAQTGSQKCQALVTFAVSVILNGCYQFQVYKGSQGAQRRFFTKDWDSKGMPPVNQSSPASKE